MENCYVKLACINVMATDVKMCRGLITKAKSLAKTLSDSMDGHADLTSVHQCTQRRLNAKVTTKMGGMAKIIENRATRIFLSFSYQKENYPVYLDSERSRERTLCEECAGASATITNQGSFSSKYL